jgi:hypothetical protein
LIPITNSCGLTHFFRRLWPGCCFTGMLRATSSRWS